MHLWTMPDIFTFGNFTKFFAHPEAINTFVYSIGVAIITTVACILLGYPAAYILTQTRMKYAQTIVVLFYPSHVGQYPDSYVGDSGAFRLYGCALGRRSIDIRYGI